MTLDGTRSLGIAPSLANRWLTSLVLLALALLALVGGPGAAQAQAAGGPTLLVLGTVSQDSDPAVASAATDALHTVARARGYTIVALDPSAPRAAIDLRTGDALSAFTVQAGVDRTLHLHVFRDGAGYALHLGLGSRDGSPGISQLRIAPLEAVGETLTEMVSTLLPAPGAPTAGQWIAPPAVAAATSEVPAPPPTTSVSGAAPMTSASAFAPAPEPVRPARPQREPRDRTPLALTIAGAAMLGAGWVFNFIGGLFAGQCLSGCSSAMEDRWQPFRGVSFIPVLGPWIQLAILPDASNWWPLWLVFDGLLQTAGAVMLIAGVATLDDEEQPVAPTIVLLPSVGPDHARLDLVGTF